MDEMIVVIKPNEKLKLRERRLKMETRVAWPFPIASSANIK